MDDEATINTYIIERSSDNKNFKPIGTIKANSALTGKYSFNDDKPADGNNYYRLRVNSIADEDAYSETRLVVNNGLHISLYPNSVKDVLNIRGFNLNQTALFYASVLLNSNIMKY